METAKISAQKKLSLCKRTNKELWAEKAHLEQLLKKAEEQQEGLRAELEILAEEKEETQEKLIQVYHQQESARPGAAAPGVLWPRARTGRGVRREGIAGAGEGCPGGTTGSHGAGETRPSEQLSEARSVKKTLESSLLEAQQHLSELEIARSHLEIQLHTVAQAKEVIQGEVRCLQWELEAERSLLKQEWENMAQELRQKELQHDNTLRLQETDHKVEINKLLQDMQAIAEGQRLSWRSEKRLLSQRLEHLQGAIARLEQEKTQLKQHNAELRRILEEVERERRRLRRSCRDQALPAAGGLSLSESEQRKMPESQQEESHTC